MKILKISSLVLFVLVVAVLASRYGGSFRLSLAQPAQALPPAQGPGTDDVGPVVRFEPFLVSEWEGTVQHMSTVTFEVEVNDSHDRDALKSRTSEIRSAILTVLADTKLGDLGIPEDFDGLKKKVQGQIQSLLPGQVVRRVLITEFLTL
jgi:flagellar basal body-associated protein FliL